MKTKFKIIAAFALTMWLVVFVQIAMTRLFTARTDFTEAFTRNQVSVVVGEPDKRGEGNLCARGQVRGRLSREEMSELAAKLFRTMGGACVMESAADRYGAGLANEYYTAYGYSVGYDTAKRVNGRRINMNVAMSYDEEKDCTNIIMGTPLINSDI